MKTVLKFTSLFVFFVLAARSGLAQESTITVIDSERLTELQSKGVIVVDVRTPEEVQQGKVPGAVHIQLGDDLATRMGDIDKNQPVIVYCKSGVRSTKASEILKKEGFTTIYNYTGSMNDWMAKGKQIE